LILLVSQGSSGNLRSHAGFLKPGIGGYETNFIHANAMGIRDCLFQLFGKFCRLCLSSGKRVYKFSELSFGHLLGELHAGKSGGRKQLRKLFFRRGPVKRNAIDQQLGSRRSKEKASLGPFRDSRSQFVPGNRQLLDNPRVVVSVQARKLQQDIQAAYECPGRRRFGIRVHRGL